MDCRRYFRELPRLSSPPAWAARLCAVTVGGWSTGELLKLQLQPEGVLDRTVLISYTSGSFCLVGICLLMASFHKPRPGGRLL